LVNTAFDLPVKHVDANAENHDATNPEGEQSRRCRFGRRSNPSEQADLGDYRDP
jgi:hypothetical protein